PLPPCFVRHASPVRKCLRLHGSGPAGTSPIQTEERLKPQAPCRKPHPASVQIMPPLYSTPAYAAGPASLSKLIRTFFLPVKAGPTAGKPHFPVSQAVFCLLCVLRYYRNFK